MLRRYECTAPQPLMIPKTMKAPHTDSAMGQKVEGCSDPSGIARAKPAKAPPKNAPAAILLRRTRTVSLSPEIRPCSRPAMYSSEGNGGAFSDNRDNPLASTSVGLPDTTQRISDTSANRNANR